METYLLKTILCSSVFIGFYYLILERQKAHQFKRFYLLFSILLSMLIPFLSITYGVAKPIENDFIFIENSDAVFVPIVEETSVLTLENSIYTVYFIVTFILLVRFLISLNALREEINSGTKIKRGNCFLVLKEEKSTAHSFWKYIFLNKTDFENGKIDDKIIRHEEAHLQQKHSFDVLFMEFLLTIFWFNPAFYLYKKAMITNHEFLADEAVLKNENDIKSYQKLLLTELISERILFTNPFNLSNTKKRIKMMTTPKNNKSKLLSWLSLPLAAVVFFAFVEKVPAQLDNKSKADSTVPVITLTTKDVVNFDDAIKYSENSQAKTSENPFEEFNRILSDYSNIVNNQDLNRFAEEVPRIEKEKLIELYQQIEPTKRKQLPLMIGYQILNKNIPTPKQILNFHDKKFAIEIDGKKIDNSLLKNYKNTDFSSVYVMKIFPNNADYDYKIRKFAVSLMTNKFFQEWNSDKKISFGFRVMPKKDIRLIKNDTIKYEAKQNQELPPPPPPVDELPMFPGGINAFRQKVGTMFDTSKMANTTGQIKSVIFFTIDSDGTTLDYRTEGESELFNTEALKAVKAVNDSQKWQPATKYGKPVRYIFRLPLMMSFEKTPNLSNMKR